ncbi:Transcriptional regulator calD [Cladobotryum mycophilum]|uniref:Transcriptional regulator calD n=1 Tax=Cladobotryum mycophilum TaxID=491253 RepID=A0ABR0S806_9HYPO
MRRDLRQQRAYKSAPTCAVDDLVHFLVSPTIEWYSQIATMYRQQPSVLRRICQPSTWVSRTRDAPVGQEQNSITAGSRRRYAFLTGPKVATDNVATDKVATDKVATDKVVPMLNIDSDHMIILSMVHSMFTFNSVLDVDKLKDSLERLLERDGWNKLGGRMRRNDKGDLEFHIPTEYSSERPAFNFSHVKHDMKLSEHPKGRHLLSSSKDPSDITVYPADYDEFLKPAGCPKTIQPFLKKDLAQISLHVVSFSDATLLVIYFPHCSLDGLGLVEMLKGWTLTLQDREGELATPYPVDQDPLSGLDDSSENHGHYSITDKKTTSRAWNWHLAKLIPRSCKDAPPFLSDNDVLCAWWMRMAISHIPEDSDKKALMINVASLRQFIEQAEPSRAGYAYLSNIFDFVTLPMTTKSLKKAPLGQLAGQIRQSLVDSQSVEHLKTLASWRKSWRYGLPAFPPGSYSQIVLNSNLSKGKMYDLDFSSAIVDRGDGDDAAGKPVDVQVRIFGNEYIDLNWITGKDANGNYLLNCITRKDNWPRIEKALESEQ